MTEGSIPMDELGGRSYTLGISICCCHSANVPILALIYSCHVGTPGMPCFINFQCFSSSSFDACKKYLPSVNNAASFFVTTAQPISNEKKVGLCFTNGMCVSLPADPVNPEIQALLLSHSAVYSLCVIQLVLSCSYQANVLVSIYTIPDAHLQKVRHYSFE